MHAARLLLPLDCDGVAWPKVSSFLVSGAPNETPRALKRFAINGACCEDWLAERGKRRCHGRFEVAEKMPISRATFGMSSDRERKASRLPSMETNSSWLVESLSENPLAASAARARNPACAFRRNILCRDRHECDFAFPVDPSSAISRKSRESQTKRY